MLGYWRAREATCVSGVSCYTLALSAGDHWHVGAQAAGEVVARTMHQLGYAASALGAADLALGPAALRRNIELAGVPHLGVQPGMQLSPSLMLDEQGVKLEIIGLSKQLNASGANGAMLAELRGWAHKIHDHGAHVGIVLSDVCVEDLADAFEQSGRDWAFLVLAIGQRCAAAEVRSPIHSVALLAAGDGFQQYARAKLTFDKNTGALLRAETSQVELRGGPNAPAEDPALAAKLAEWSQQP
jgi:2',3'-cyclic-nucleotide 2'-phosphodiesterase (5'-nucleotidase family)